MCILFWTYNRHPEFQFIFAGNRDEFLHRPTARAQFWNPPNDFVLAGRDLSPSATDTHDGTWLGITRDGRFAALTNYREKLFVGKLSRGYLVRDYLINDKSPSDFMKSVQPHKKDFGGFNLICGQLGKSPSLYYTSNREDEGITELQPGEIYGLSNSILQNPWEKVKRGKSKFQEIVDNVQDKEELIEALFNMMRESCPYSGSTTAIWEEVINTIFVSKVDIESLSYATRVTTIVLVDYKGHATFIEKEWYQSTSELSYQLHMEGNSDDPERRYEFELTK
ncbi:NRDE protein-domain-containing protein [Umbelopsis sp. PMI_123]|nr:NRDE protein-domain-containing protein [Umbelopsis sp. PMI_123]